MKHTLFTLVALLSLICTATGTICPSLANKSSCNMTIGKKETYIPRVSSGVYSLRHRAPCNHGASAAVDIGLKSAEDDPTGGNRNSSSTATASPNLPSAFDGNTLIEHIFRIFLTVLTLFNVTFTWRIHGVLLPFCAHRLSSIAADRFCCQGSTLDDGSFTIDVNGLDVCNMKSLYLLWQAGGPFYALRHVSTLGL